MAGPGEFELIREYFSSRFQSETPAAGVELGIGDDCALLNPPAGQVLATSVDTLVAGVHFPAAADPYRIASRALRVNLSDLAAMNARPLWFTLALTLPESDATWLGAVSASPLAKPSSQVASLALTLPESDATWLEGFARGLAETARRFGITLIGGDTTKGPLSITIQVTGASTRPLRRDGAAAGDIIFVSNALGAATAALPIVLGDIPGSAQQQQQADAAYYFPEPQFDVVRQLSGYASAGLDISDGLLADLGHICQASKLGAELDVDCVPVAELAQTMRPESALETALTGGDDYQLCFTVPQQHRQHVAQLGLPITAIGRMVAAAGIRCHQDGKPWQTGATGYRHF